MKFLYLIAAFATLALASPAANAEVSDWLFNRIMILEVDSHYQEVRECKGWRVLSKRVRINEIPFI
jgi:hypothetical protein